MRKAATLLRKAGYSVTIAAALVFSNTTPAGTIGLPDTPIFLASGAQPNLVMAIDDSGSMDFEVLFPANDGAAWWRLRSWGSCTETDANSFVGCRNNATGTDDIPAPGQLNFNNSGENSFNVPQDDDGNNDIQVWRKFVYLFPNGADIDDRGDQDDEAARTTARRRLNDGGGHYAIPPIPAYAWARSPDINSAYFDPSETYDRWTSNEDYTFADSTPAAARFDPVFQTNLTIDLTQDRAGTGSVAVGNTCSGMNNGVADDYYFRVYRGMTIPAGTCVRASGANSWTSLTSDCAVGNNGCSLGNGASVAIRYFPATFYLKPTTRLPDGFGYTGATITGKAPDGTNLNGYEIKRSNFSSETAYNTAIRNFANWFTYYRKRHQALRAGLGQAFSDINGIRVDGYTINNQQGVTMGSIDNNTNKRALYDKFYTDWVRYGGTPNRSAVARMIREFKRTDGSAPVTASCQKNFGMLFTDGFSNSPDGNDGIPAVNVDQNSGDPYSDGYSGSLADAVMGAYTNPLRTGNGFPSGKVSVSNQCPAAGTTYSGPLDCNRDLHMNFFAVTLNTRGLQFNVPGVQQNPYITKPLWPTNFPPRHPSAVDDLWHATVNGRGQLLNATSPKDISTQLRAVLSSVVQKTSSAAAAAVNGGVVSENSRVYQARFDSSDWSGQLLTYGIDDKTGKTTSTTDAATNIPAAASRRIFTRTSAGQTVEFTWANLQADTTRVAQLDSNSNAAAAESMLNYLRGDQSNEGIETDDYRQRTTLLGDIVNSAPLYVGAPPFRYRDSLESAPYSAFVTSKRNRTPMIYVGANDGMLHAFNGTTATEAFAYIPTSVFPNLSALASKTYGHRFYVDGSPSMGDAYFSRTGESGGARWRTVLVGGLNKGGQGVYALDITDPSSLGAGSVLWEFTDANDVDLGFTYSQPTIAKLRDGKWYAVFGNGYNSRLADGRASTTGSAVLFIVDLGTGVARKIDTGEGFAQRGETGNASDQAITYDNGLATPSLVDTNGDRVVEYAYAGDLYGNMWKFDLSSTNPNNWQVAFSGAPLFKARNDAGQLQPITARPEVTRGPMGNGLMVLFGTGKYLEPDDKLISPARVNSFYGIVDRNAAVTVGTNALRNTVLTKQSILREVTVNRTSPRGETITSELRITTDNMLGANQGWYMDLVSPVNGYENEKQVTEAVVRDQRVIFTTLTPDTDPCGYGGTSWLMELDLRDGSRLEISPFDLNIDGQFDNVDMVLTDLGDGNGPLPIPPGGIRKKLEGILARPTIVNGEFGTEGKPVQYKYMPGSSGNIVVIIENPGADSTGRQSWRQVR